jgi:hypothetical protein
MSKGIEKPKFQELLNDLNAVREIPQRIETLNLIRLKELHIFLNSFIQDLLKSIDFRLRACPEESFEYAAKNCFQYDYNYYNLVSLRDFIAKRINELQRPAQASNPPKENQPKWFPIGLGFATGEIQKKLKTLSAREIAKEYQIPKYHNMISLTKANTSIDPKNIYSDFNKLKLLHKHCTDNDIKMCPYFKDAYNKKLKEIS